MSAALHALQPGSSVAIKGPCGTFRYQPGKYKAIGETHHPFLLMTGIADAPLRHAPEFSSTTHVWTAQRAPNLATLRTLREASHLRGLKYHNASPSMVSCFMLAHVQGCTLTWSANVECILAAGLLAGGTGVTAMVNLATVILKNPADKVKVRAQHLSNVHIASVCWRGTA